MSIFKNGIKVSGQFELGGTTGSTSDIITGGDTPAFTAASSVVGDNWHNIEVLRRGQKSETMHVFLLAGQSNMAGGVTVSGYTPDRQGVDAPHPRVLEVSKGNTAFTGYRTAPEGELQVIQVPGQSSETTPGGIRLNMNQIFGKRFAELIGGDSKIVIINRANGETGFIDGEWDAGNTGNLLDLAIQDVIAFLEAHPEASFSGICWHQGEDDALKTITQQQYEDYVSDAVDEIRTRIPGATNAPFVCGTMHRNMIENPVVTSRAEVDAAHRNVNAYVTNSDVVIMDQFYNGDYLDFSDADPSIGAHFDFNAIRYMGRTYAERMVGLIEDVKPPRQTGVWMEYDQAAGEFRDRWGSGHRVFNGSYVEDTAYGGALNFFKDVNDEYHGYTTDIPLSNKAYTKIIRIRFQYPGLANYDNDPNGIADEPNLGSNPAQTIGGDYYQLISGALQAQVDNLGTADPLDIGTWWTTITHQHLFNRSTGTNINGLPLGSGGEFGIGQLVAYNRYHTLALTYDSELAVESRFEEYIDGVNPNIGAKLITPPGATDGNQGGQTIPTDSLVVQIGCWGDTLMTAEWAGQVAAVIILPYAATPAEIAGIHADLERQERESGSCINLGYATPAGSGLRTAFDWKTLNQPGRYRVQIHDSYTGATPDGTNRPVEEHDLPWNAAQFAQLPASLSANVYDIEIEHAGQGRGFIKVRTSAYAGTSSLNGVGALRLVVREFTAQLTNNLRYDGDWTPQYVDGNGKTVWTELTPYRESPNGQIWEVSLDNSGTDTWSLVQG